jgi:hypothetical protein
MTAASCVPPPQPREPKIDLLFMIDNSSSMADKQEVLGLAVPDLVSRFVDPACVDPMTLQVLGPRNGDGSCTKGEPEFAPIRDIHIGIITSSLGGHGSSGVCDQPDSRKSFPHNDDKGHLITRGPMDTAVDVQGNGFLNWNPGMGGASTPDQIIRPFAEMVAGVGQHGCGYEAQLEAIYRFLIDPDPYEAITVDKRQSALGTAVLTGTDAVLRQQRADFLRPDSLVSIIMVTDENDCSIIDGGQNFYVIVPPSGAPPKSILTHGTSACSTNPNDPCCFSCLEHNSPDDPPPPGCVAPAGDPECAKGQWLKTEDPENLRCLHQKQRYGIDFLYPVQRYIDGLTKTEVLDRHGNRVKNPLYSDLTCKDCVCAPPRGRNLVFLAGIVGIPWQDIAADPTDLTKGYKTSKQIADENLWPKIIGDPENSAGPVPPTDRHMIESVSPRSGLAGPGSAATADPIHGHDWDTSKDSPANRDLQYACVFNLMQPKTCFNSTDCDCAKPIDGSVADVKNPLCQNVMTDVYSTTQWRAKAYPAIRELEVLKGVGEQAIVASICPANMNDSTREDFGFRPAIAALLQSVRAPLRACF